MKVFFDQNVPRDLRRFLPGNYVRTAAEMQWDRLKNGNLLQAAEDAGFELMITSDKSLAYQQNLAKRKLAILELTRTNWPSIKPNVARIAEAVNQAKPSDYRIIDCESSGQP